MKKLLSIVLVITLVCSILLSSCGSNEQNSNVSKVDPNFEILAMPDDVSVGLDYELEADGDGYALVGRGTFDGDVLVIPSNYDGKPVTSVAQNAFQFDDKLASVYIPDTVTIIGEDAFSYCDNLTIARIGTGVTFISQFAFANTAIERIVLPDSVEFVDYTAFWYCKSLHTIVLGHGITQLGGNYETDSEGNIVTTRFDGFTDFLGCSSLVKILVDESHPVYKTIDGNIFSKDGKTIVKYAMGNDGTEYLLDSSVSTIGRGAFCGANNLLYFTIPDTIITVSEFAFSDCNSLISVDIGASVSYIGQYAFDACPALENIHVSPYNQYYFHEEECLYSRNGVLMHYSVASSKTEFATLMDIEVIDFSAFRYAVNLKSIHVASGVKKIQPQAFMGCTNLERIVISDTVEYIGFFAFNGCDNLEVIEFEGTVEQWNNIQKDTSWNYGISGVVVECTDGLVKIGRAHV